MGKFRRFPVGKHSKPLASGYALTVKVTKDPNEIVNQLLVQPYVKYVVWCIEYGDTNYHHMHIHVEHKTKLHRKNRYYDEILGAHPYIQRVGESPLDKRKLWTYYMKDGDWHCLHRNSAKSQKLKDKIKKEVTMGDEISQEVKHFVERMSVLNETRQVAVANFLKEYTPNPKQ